MQHVFNISAQVAKVAAFWLMTATPGVVDQQRSISDHFHTPSLLAEIQLPHSNPRRR